MPSNSKKYLKANYARFWGTPKAIKDRSERNKARRIMVKAGKAHKGDGKDVGHVKPIARGGKTVRSNLSMQTRKYNRGKANPRHK